MFGRGDKKEGIKGQEVNAFLGEGTEFEGKLSFHGMVRLDGKFKGEIAAQDTLVVGETGEVEAIISADVVVVSGIVRGNVEAKTRLEIHRPGSLHGDVKTRSLVVTEGAILNGRCLMSDDAQTLSLVDKKGQTRSPGPSNL